jgi:hypothetical protein
MESAKDGQDLSSHICMPLAHYRLGSSSTNSNKVGSKKG